MLDLEELTVSAGQFRLQGVGFTVKEGECHAVLGPSGSGKSTLLNAVLGVLHPEQGRIRLGGRDITHVPVEQRGLGYVPQHLGLFPHLTVEQNIYYSARARGLSPGDHRELMNKLVEATGIGSLLGRRPSTLSGGERQRVALVRALASGPRVVLLDEPFSSLNESLRLELWWLLDELRRERGLTVLLITHDLTEAYALSERATILIGGRMCQTGEKAEVFRWPATVDAARFLGIKNLFEGRVSEVRDEQFDAHCLPLGGTVTLSGRTDLPPQGATIMVGVHAANVALRDAAHPPQPDEYVLEGTITLRDMGRETAILLRQAEPRLCLEFSISRRLVDRFKLEDGQTGVQVGIPRTALFWIRL